jgi:hypothetical protein
MSPLGQVPALPGACTPNSTLVISAAPARWASCDINQDRYFQISPLDLGVGVQEYVLRSLSLFSPAIVIGAVALIAVTTARAWHPDLTRLTALAGRAAARTPGPLPGWPPRKRRESCARPADC